MKVYRWHWSLVSSSYPGARCEILSSSIRGRLHRRPGIERQADAVEVGLNAVAGLQVAHKGAFRAHVVERQARRVQYAIVTESLRRYLESHQDLINQQFIREDVEWGLSGND